MHKGLILSFGGTKRFFIYLSYARRQNILADSQRDDSDGLDDLSVLSYDDSQQVWSSSSGHASWLHCFWLVVT